MQMRVMAATILFVAVIAFCRAGEQPRRFPLELEVLATNASRLTSSLYTPRYKQGLRLRMAGSLGYLKFLAREYLQVTGRPDKHLLNRITHLRQLFGQGKWRTFALQSRKLADEYPFVMTGLAPERADVQAIASGRQIYRHLCIGCHEHPDMSQAVPAPDLFDMARTEPRRELIARLITGVHGTPAVALRNPFSNREIAGLAAYLKSHAKTSSPAGVRH